MAIDLNQPFIDDVRMPVAGDSFGWEGTEPAAAKQALIIHHSGTNTALNNGAEDAFSIANFHTNTRGWGGIGYHFVITHDSHPGGARVQYAGDLGTWRAHILNQNPGKVGICLVGNFLEQLPGENQLRLARQLVDFLMAQNNILPSINYPSQIFGHGLYPGQQTAGEQCPGFAGPGFAEWFGYIRGGNFPDGLYPHPQQVPVDPPAPTPAEVTVVPAEEPVVSTPDPQPVDNRPEWEKTWTPDATIPRKVIAVPSADVYDFVAGKVVKSLAGGEEVNNPAGYFAVNSNLYLRTQWSVDNNRWNGILVGETRDFQPPDPNPTGLLDGIQPPAEAPVGTPENPGSVLADDPQPDPVPEVPSEPKKTTNLIEALRAILEALLGFALSPLRLYGWISSLTSRKEQK